MRKRDMIILLAAVLALVGVSESFAWRPSGWVFMNYPYAFDRASSDWYYFNETDTQWVNRLGHGDGWSTLAASAMVNGWTFFNWPYAFCRANSAWYYLNEVDAQWVVKMSAGQWGVFGIPPAPAGMVTIPAGTNMGVDPDDRAYNLTVTSFYMDQHEVTGILWMFVHQWGLDNGYPDISAGTAVGLYHPVVSVNWYDCIKWSNARSERSGLTPAYYTDEALTQVYRAGAVNVPYVDPAADGYRLPTLDQWQYAARGGVANLRYPWGNEIRHSDANYLSADEYDYDVSPTRGYHPDTSFSIYPRTLLVGSFDDNGYGLYDMSGNVSEWCEDYTPIMGSTYRAQLGGDWYYKAEYCTIARTIASLQSYSASMIGLRTVRFPPAAR